MGHIHWWTFIIGLLAGYFLLPGLVGFVRGRFGIG